MAFGIWGVAKNILRSKIGSQQKKFGNHCSMSLYFSKDKVAVFTLQECLSQKKTDSNTEGCALKPGNLTAPLTRLGEERILETATSTQHGNTPPLTVT